jgi:hypothetical protein
VCLPGVVGPPWLAGKNDSRAILSSLSWGAGAVEPVAPVAPSEEPVDP